MSGDRVIRTTFIISILSHGLFLAMPSFNINLPKFERPKEITLQIEIEKPSLLPKIERMGDASSASTEEVEEKKIKEVIEKPEPERQVGEMVLPARRSFSVGGREVSPQPVKERVDPAPIHRSGVKVLNPADASSASTEEVDEAMLRYQDMVKQRIEEVRRYPDWAKEQGIEGVTHLRFIVLANGSGQGIKLMRPSGSKILDQEAMATIKRASPFPPFPKEIASSSIQMEVSLIFTLK